MNEMAAVAEGQVVTAGDQAVVLDIAHRVGPVAEKAYLDNDWGAYHNLKYKCALSF